jgi:cobalamin biosynthesis protein CobT
MKVRNCQNTKDCVELAEVIYKLLDEACKEFNKEQKGEKPEKQKGQKPEKQKGEKGQKGEPQSSQPEDMPDEDEEGEEGEGKKSDKKDSKKSEKKESKKSGKKDDSEEDEADEKDSKGKDSKNDKDEEGDSDLSKEGADEQETEEEDGEGSEGDKDEDSDEEADGKGKGNDADKDLEDESKSGKDDGAESDAQGSKGSEGDGSESDGMDSDEEAESAQGDSDKKADSESAYKPSDIEDGDSATAKEQGKSEIENECKGQDQREILNERLGELFDKLSPADKDYLACRDNDIHRVPTEGVNDKATFVERRNQIGAGVSAMTRALEQALRSMAKCRKDPYLRQGKIDKKRLVAITKSLSKEVFFKIRPGIDLDVAVEILVDESGSMGNFLDVQKVAMAIGEALSQIGIPFEIMGATTQFLGGYSIPSLNGLTRTNPIVYNHYKGFGENWVAVRHRIIHTSADKHNVDGEFVEYAAYRLAARKESRKVIFSLSDGEPCAGHDNDSLMGKNLKDVCNRIRKNGMEVYGFGIGTQAPESFYGKRHFVYLDKPDQMGQDFIRKFADVITDGKVNV